MVLTKKCSLLNKNLLITAVKHQPSNLYFERTENLKENKFNFGTIILIKESGRAPGSKTLVARLTDSSAKPNSKTKNKI